MVLEFFSRVFRPIKDDAPQSEPFSEKMKRASFFRTSPEFRDLAKLPPSEFILRLSDKHLLLQIAGASRDSLIALKDEVRAEKFLEILKSDFWKDHGFKGTPQEHVANAVAFLMANDGNTLEQESPFLDFCRKNGVPVEDDYIEERAKKFKRHDTNS